MGGAGSTGHRINQQEYEYFPKYQFLFVFPLPHHSSQMELNEIMLLGF